jgi:hypothetical protein
MAAVLCSNRQIYESMLFLFVEHAYDVGDLLEVEAVQYRVKKIGEGGSSHDHWRGSQGGSVSPVSRGDK